MSETPVSKVLTWVARIWSLASIALLLAFVFGGLFNGPEAVPKGAEWVRLILWPGGVVVGLVVAWFRKGLGGAIAVVSLIGFYFWQLLDRGTFPGGPYFLLITAPAFLFLLSALLSRPRHGMRSA